MRIDNSEHTKHPWRVHSLLSDFEVEDVWRFPVILEEKHALKLFQEQFKIGTETMSKKGAAGMLFRFRMFLGKIFKWDEKPKHDKLIPGSIRERYAQAEGLSFEQLPDPGQEDFIPVYNLENESLSEIKNATVHAGLHMGKVPTADGKFTVQMAVYVKPTGLLGRFYMLLITPFRLFIVYPAMMQMAGKAWSRFLHQIHTQ